LTSQRLVPRYLEIEQVLRRELARLSPGDKLPTDAELCERFGVSRLTARAAIARLAQEGLIYRERGRGTFVSQPPVHRHMGRLLSFSEDMRQRGLQPSSEVLEIGTRPSTDDDREQLGIADEEIVFVQRLRLANDLPMAIEEVHLPLACQPVLSADLVNGSLHEALQVIGRIPMMAEGRLVPESLTDEDARLLHLPAGRPLLVEHRLIFDQLQQPLELTQTRYSPERYVFDIRLISGHAAGD
jgi:GntR family transcriptional regulator